VVLNTTKKAREEGAEMKAARFSWSSAYVLQWLVHYCFSSSVCG